MTDDTTRSGGQDGEAASEPIAILQPLPASSHMGAAGTLLLALALGAVLGAGGLALSAGGLAGTGTEARLAATAASASATPGMDLLNDYRCDSGETKTIILGGREDGFSQSGTDPDALPAPGDMRPIHALREGSDGAVGVDRVYDSLDMDTMLLDRFAVPRRTAHGIIVTRLDERSSKRNDTIGLGDLNNRIAVRHGWGHRISELHRVPGITVFRDALPGELVRIELTAVRFPTHPNLQGEIVPQVHPDLLSYIRDGEGEAADVQFSAIEDTAVDFVGFALCEEPAEHRGFSLHVQAVESDPELLLLNCDDGTGEVCNANRGDTLCSAALPLACFRRGDPAVPATLSVEGSRSWSGGAVDFTEPVVGASFASREQAQALCRARFGPDWRVADYHDGRTFRTIIARGTPDVERAWVDARLQQYGSCWPRGEDYGDDYSGELAQ